MPASGDRFVRMVGHHGLSQLQLSAVGTVRSEGQSEYRVRVRLPPDVRTPRLDDNGVAIDKQSLASDRVRSEYPELTPGWSLMETGAPSSVEWRSASR